MYVTRYRSELREHRSYISLPPSEGPNSGYLVIQDEPVRTFCCGLCTDTFIRQMPFPQNKTLCVSHIQEEDIYDVFFIPALNQPLSSNRYYVIEASGRNEGGAYVCSRKKDKVTSFGGEVEDLKPREFDLEDVYQQVEITACDGGFVAKSVAQDGIPPRFLTRKGWDVRTSTPDHFELSEAHGINNSLRARLPNFDDFPASAKTSKWVVVGKWYIPFIFVKEEMKLENQMRRSMYYQVTLEQQWRQIFECENRYSDTNFVAVDVPVRTDVASRFGNEALQNHAQGVTWFSIVNVEAGGRESKVGLSSAVMERMRWEQERMGWESGLANPVRIERVEEFQGENKNGWKKYGCYVLVERFAFKRMDGSLLLDYEFRHLHQIRSKWE